MTDHTQNNKGYKSDKFIDATAVPRQSGVSLIEVLIAMFILAFGSLAIVNLQTSSAIAIGSSADHFKIDKLSQGIVEQLKADIVGAAAGDYNTDFTDTQAPANTPTRIAHQINEWKASVARSIPQGQTRIQCTESACDIALKWYEVSHFGVSDQTFNVKTPL